MTNAIGKQTAAVNSTCGAVLPRFIPIVVVRMADIRGLARNLLQQDLSARFRSSFATLAGDWNRFDGCKSVVTTGTVGYSGGNNQAEATMEPIVLSRRRHFEAEMWRTGGSPYSRYDGVMSRSGCSDRVFPISNFVVCFVGPAQEPLSIVCVVCGRSTFQVRQHPAVR